MSKAGFCASRWGAGFRIDFSSGWGISVGFNPTVHHCEGYPTTPYAPVDAAHFSPDAEIAVFDAGGRMIYLDDDGDNIRGWVTPALVARVIAVLASDNPTEERVREACTIEMWNRRAGEKKA